MSTVRRPQSFIPPPVSEIVAMLVDSPAESHTDIFFFLFQPDQLTKPLIF